LNKVALVIATHNGTAKLDLVSQWIKNQLPWRGPLIVIASGLTNPSSLTSICKKAGIDLVYKDFLDCGLAKRNLGAEIATGMGADYVTFLNDYQCLQDFALHNFETEAHIEDIVFGNVEFDKVHGVTRPAIGYNKTPLSKKSSNREIWALFSSVSEAGMLIKNETFVYLNGWMYPNLKGKTFLGGDGMYLTSRVYSFGGTFGYSKSYIVLGGHRNLDVTMEMARSKGAVYPYAFTLSTKYRGVPKWISIRFISGRIFRALQALARSDIRALKNMAPEIGSRLRAYLNLKPSKYSEPLNQVYQYNCKASQYYCLNNGATKCPTD
jgi:hypothetical protein